MKKWCIKGSGDFKQFVSSHRAALRAGGLVGDRRDFFYYFNPKAKRLEWNLSPPYNYEEITIEVLEELYKMRKATKECWTIRGSFSTGKFLSSILTSEQLKGFNGSNVAFFYHFENNKLIGSTVNEWDVEVIDVSQLKMFYETKPKVKLVNSQPLPFGYSVSQLRKFDGYPIRFEFTGKSFKGIIKFEDNRVGFLQNDQGGADWIRTPEYRHSFCYNIHNDIFEPAIYNQIKNFYFDVKEFKLISNYPQRALNSKAVLDPATGQFVWAIDREPIPADFQPDITPDWFEPIYSVSLPTPQLDAYKLELIDWTRVGADGDWFCTKAAFGCVKFDPKHLADVYGGLNHLIVDKSSGHQIMGITVKGIGVITLAKIKEILDYVNQEELKRK